MIDVIYNFYNNPQIHPYFLLILAAFCGGALGTERQRAGHREAGRRTLSIVALGSCLFSMLPLLAHQVADPWRMASQVITGCGFIGAGVLLKENFTVKGLTTASAIWVSSAIGICFAVDMILMGIFCTAFTFLILRIKKEPFENKSGN